MHDLLIKNLVPNCKLYPKVYFIQEPLSSGLKKKYKESWYLYLAIQLQIS